MSWEEDFYSGEEEPPESLRRKWDEEEFRETSPVECRHCGKLIAEDSFFCIYCGKRVISKSKFFLSGFVERLLHGGSSKAGFFGQVGGMITIGLILVAVILLLIF